MVAGADQGDAFKRDMGYSVEEFFRILPSAVGDHEYMAEGGRIVVRPRQQDRELVLKINALPDRKIGMIRIPRIEVDFCFQNFSRQERREFLVAFDRSFQRGGG